MAPKRLLPFALWLALRKKLAAASTFSLIMISLCTGVMGQQTAIAGAADNFASRQTSDALSGLSASAQSVIKRLSGLSSMPISDWRFHAGDFTHGESVNLDDTGWPAIQTPCQTTTTDLVWLRTWVEVPPYLDGYDLRGSRIWIKSWRDNNVTVYFNGQRVAAGEDLEPTVLVESAKPGERVLIAIRIQKTADPKLVPKISLHFDAAVGRPSLEDLYTEFVSAALLAPHLAHDVQGSLAILEKAIGDIDMQSLDAKDQQKFDESMRQSQKHLGRLHDVVAKPTLYLAGNSHIDSAWLWPSTETVDIVKRTFQSALQLMNEYPDFTYTQSAAQYNEWMAEKYPNINDEIKQRIKEGRWEVVGGMWVEPDLNMPMGESLVRQLLIGQRTLNRLYGVTTKIGWNPDSFGYNWQLPQIYKKSGVDYFVTQKMAGNETNPLPLKLFWWESPDGSKVLSYFPHGYGNEDLNPVRLSNDLLKARTQALGIVDLMDLYGVGDHGGGPTRATIGQGMHWKQSAELIATIKFGTAQTYFNTVEKKISRISPTWNYGTMADNPVKLSAPPTSEIVIPTWKDELYFEHHRGTYTTQAKHKQNMRESEVHLIDAEEYSSLAWLYGKAYPTDALNDAWKKTLFNQFHDLAAGSGIGVIYQDAQRDYDQVRWATDEASSRALHAIQARINTRAAGPVPVLVVNSLGWQRSGLVHVDVQMPASSDGVSVLDSQQRILPSEILSEDDQTNTYHLLVEVKDVPSVGYEVLQVVPGKRPFASDLRVSQTTMENAALKVVVNPRNGCITSIYQKHHHFEALAKGACGNQIQMFDDTPQGDDAWNIDPGTFDHFTPVMQADSVSIIVKGPLRSVIRVARTWHSTKIVQDIVLYTGSDEIEVLNEIDWRETHTLMKVAFPLAASSRMATYETPFGTIERPTSRNNTWEQAKFEVPALRWADLGNEKSGFSLINESKYGYDCEANVLRLTLLRSPVEPDPNADRGHHHFSFSLYPHAASWKSALTIQRGFEYNSPLEALQVDPHWGSMPPRHSFVNIESRNVVMTALKKAEDADGLIFRFYEWEGKDSLVKLHIPEGGRSATLANLMEKPEGNSLPIRGLTEVTFQVHPYEIISLRVDYTPGQN